MTKKKNDEWHQANGGYMPRQEDRGYSPKSSVSPVKPPKGGSGESGKSK